MKKILSYGFYIFCKIFFKVYCPLEVYGRENLPASSFILSSNHCSHMDAPVLMLATGLPFKQFGMVAAKDYFFKNHKQKSLATWFMNLIPINRKASKKTLLEDIAMCKNFVDKNARNLIIYPEGTRSITGEMKEFKRGPALIATELDVPIVPAFIDGTKYSLGKGRNFPRRNKIRVVLGKPITTPYHNDMQKTNLLKQMTANLENAVKQLKDTHS